MSSPPNPHLSATVAPRLPSTLKKNLSTEYTYDRDFLLNLLNINSESSLGPDHFPEDFDSSLGCFIDGGEEDRLPLAHLPLSDVEKKLLSMLSINSDAGRRSNYNNQGGQGAGGERKHREHGAANRENHRNNNRQPREDRRPKEIKSDDLWDISPAGAPQGFGADGVFGVVSPGSTLNRRDEDRAPVAQRNAWSVLMDDGEGGPGSNRSSPPHKPLDLGYDGGRSVLADPFGGQTAPAPSTGFESLLHQSSPFGSSLMGIPQQQQPQPQLPAVVPGFTFTPPQWVYQDPSQRLQGPFTSEQMHGWFKEGYFPLNLPIKCVGDANFVPLKQIVDRYGSEAPFLNALDEQEALEKQYFIQQQQAQQHQPAFLRQPIAPQPIAPQPIAAPQSQHLHRAVSSSPPSAIGTLPVQAKPAVSENQAFLNFMSQKQKLEAEESKPVAAPPTSTGLSQTRTTSEKREKSPGKRPASPSEPTVASINKEIKQMHVADPAPTPAPAPAPTPAPAPAPVAKPVVKKEEGGVSKKEKPHAKKVSQQVVEAVAVAEPPKKTNVAPWATKSAPAVSVSEIQQQESVKAAEKKRVEQAEADKKVVAEAAALKRAAEAAVPAPLPASWGKDAAGGKKKTLAEIMEDEAKAKQSGTAVSVSKGYAASVASSTAPKSFAAKASSAAVKVASGPVLKPTAAVPASGGGEWSVVGAKASPTTPVKTPTATAPASAPKLNYSGAPGPVTVNGQGVAVKKSGAAPALVSESFKTWYRKALFAVSKATSLNVEEFVGILLSVPIKEVSTITMICDDALSSAIDARKFASEFVARRRADLEGVAYSPEAEGWTAVKKGASSLNVAAAAAPTEVDGFEVVGKKGKKGKK